MSHFFDASGGSQAWSSCPCVPVSARLEGLMDLYSQGYERSYTVNSSILNAIEPHLKDFQQLLLDPPKVKDVA